ncbi:putative transmembrane ascorbate-dependent reductase CYB561 homolog [Lucilia cuprina]|uniref:putative transmembrane ascorbate-dependent reductase CYB561 homolog n=1 Tax=Lucilia cuprina TaxID=7375 RepID=UPI001F065FC2|nr:putative transmembrane ascorbate-dependent reductase CYB561 homolog [Lucilia cuprina]
MKIKPAQVAAFAFMMGYTIFGLMCLKLVYNRQSCNGSFYLTKGYQWFTTGIIGPHIQVDVLFDNRFCAGSLHGFLSCASTYVLGYAVAVYRLFNGFRTRFVKLLHVGLHAISLAFFACGYFILYFAEYNVEYDYNKFHAYTSIFVCCMYLLQIIVGLSTFFLQRNIQLRLKFAPFHDVFGIWLIIALVACCISGKHYALIDYTKMNQNAFYSLTFVSYSFLLIVVLNPFFEWDLVGHI